jgi:hypothetical protein
MKKFLLISVLTLFAGRTTLYACAVCKSRQQEAFQAFGHAAPDTSLDYFIIIGASLIVLSVMIMSIWYLVNPREKNSDHIKNLIISDN